ncbi:hypothetical protein ACFCYN_18730 [Gottfriedia sp. NPDC056225]|uniref:hypothetical protein n=1 Tax=Gottfriedia sp. NPDC056225 TaxID=3345751 RepID=UPI0035E21E4F
MIGSKIRIAKDKLSKGEVHTNFSNMLFVMLNNAYTKSLEKMELNQQKEEYKEKLKDEPKAFDINIMYNWLEN